MSEIFNFDFKLGNLKVETITNNLYFESNGKKIYLKGLGPTGSITYEDYLYFQNAIDNKYYLYNKKNEVNKDTYFHVHHLMGK